MKWRMESPCENCPFNTCGAGLHLKKSLRPGRWREITAGLLRGLAFYCHKTTREDEDGEPVPGEGLMCAGAIAWANKRGASSQLQRVMGRLDAVRNATQLGGAK